MGNPIVDAVDPEEAWRLLGAEPDALLVDVRTGAEWAFVGQPDLDTLGKRVLPVEWARFPAMARNDVFVDELRRLAGGALPRRILFICRSGGRSLAAARLVAETCADDPALERCTNVAEGFEGDLDGDDHRGRINGWKARGLPWRQT